MLLDYSDGLFNDLHFGRGDFTGLCFTFCQNFIYKIQIFSYLCPSLSQWPYKIFQILNQHFFEHFILAFIFPISLPPTCAAIIIAAAIGIKR